MQQQQKEEPQVQLYQHFLEDLSMIKSYKTENRPDHLMKMIKLCLWVQKPSIKCVMFEKIFLEYKTLDMQLPLLDDKDIQTLIAHSDILSLCILYEKRIIYSTNQGNKIMNYVIEKKRQYSLKIRNRLTDQIYDPSEIEKLFYTQEILECTTFQEWYVQANIIKYKFKLLFDIYSDSFYLKLIFDQAIKALFLTANPKIVSQDHLLKSCIDSLIKYLESLHDNQLGQECVYYWTIIFKCILNPGGSQETTKNLYSPNLVSRLILSQIPYVEDLYILIKNYILKSINFHCDVFTNLLQYGSCQQSLILINLIFQDISQGGSDNKEIIIAIPIILNRILQSIENFDCLYYSLDILTFLFIKREYNQKDSFSVNIDRILNKINQIQEKTKIEQELYNKINQFISSMKQKFPNQQFFKIQSSKIKLPINLVQKNNENPKNQIQQFGISKKQSQYIGLFNLQNTCYINSYIQALFWTRKFRNYVLEIKAQDSDNSQSKSKASNNVLSNRTTLLQALKDLFLFLSSFDKELVPKSSICFIPIDLKRNLREPYKSEMGQQDAGEFGLHLFEDLEKESEMEAGIQDNFRGITQSNVQCLKCNETFQGPTETFLQQTLNFPEMENKNQEFRVSEHIQNELRLHFQYNCPNCKTTQNGIKNSSYKLLPNTFIIVLNRFVYKEQVRMKVQYNIEYEQLIELKENDKTLKYELVSYINHYGIAQGGHYTTLVKDGNQWINFDDSNVTIYESFNEVVKQQYEINQRHQQQIAKQNPYILFYQRKEA